MQAANKAKRLHRPRQHDDSRRRGPLLQRTACNYSCKWSYKYSIDPSVSLPTRTRAATAPGPRTRRQPRPDTQSQTGDTRDGRDTGHTLVPAPSREQSLRIPVCIRAHRVPMQPGLRGTDTHLRSRTRPKPARTPQPTADRKLRASCVRNNQLRSVGHVLWRQRTCGLRLPWCRLARCLHHRRP